MATVARPVVLVPTAVVRAQLQRPPAQQARARALAVPVVPVIMTDLMAAQENGVAVAEVEVITQRPPGAVVPGASAPSEV